MNGTLISNKSYPTKPEDLTEYAIVVAGSETFLGTCAEAPAPWNTFLTNAIKLENCYFVLGGFPTDGKSINRVRLVLPIELLSSANYKLVIPSSIFPLTQLDAGDRRQILAEIANAEKMRIVMRADKSGIVMPGTM
jgi:hypothetical protein